MFIKVNAFTFGREKKINQTYLIDSKVIKNNKKICLFL